MAPAERSDEARKRPVERSGTYFLVTIKRNAVEFTPRKWLSAQLQRVVTKTKGEWGFIAFELDGLSRLHLHTVVKLDNRPYLKGLSRKGWHIHFAEFPKEDIVRVLSYLHKVNQNPYYLDQLESESATYLAPYPFVEE